jgi:type II secretory pathway pseudopilin PulG
LLVVIAIISLLSAVVLASLSDAREEARISAAESELQQIHGSLQFLINNTGNWPFGCRPGIKESEVALSLPEGSLKSPEAAMVTQPPVGTNGPCEWTSQEVSSWNGPYTSVSQLEDPWGRDYKFDADYLMQSCHEYETGVYLPVILSEGINDQGENSYDCDDIIYRVE